MLKRKYKGFIRRTGSSMLVGTLLMSVLFINAGCSSMDNTQINAAIANSSLAKKAIDEFNKQITIVEDLKMKNIISEDMANVLKCDVVSNARHITSISSGVVSESGNSGDGKDVDVSKIGKGDKPQGVVELLQSMSDLAGPPGKNVMPGQSGADDNIREYGSPINQAMGYNTRGILESNLTGYSKMAGFSSGVVPLRPFGAPTSGGNNNSSIHQLWQHLEDMKTVTVHYINPNSVSDTKSLQGLKTAIDCAKAGKTPDSGEDISKYFTALDGDDKKLKLSDGIPEEELYSVKTIPVQDSPKGNNTDPACTFDIYELNEDKIIEAFGKTKSLGSLEMGELIGHDFYITRYPMAIFRGFEQDSSDKSKYKPVFTHPFYLKDGAYGALKGSLFDGPASGYSDALTDGDKGTSETKEAFVDLYKGTMYYNGVAMGTRNDYMSVGNDKLESSVLIRPSNSVFVDSDNPNCINTVSGTVMPITETIGVNSDTSVSIPNAGGAMPVVFLMDYLELVYSPNTVGTDPFTAYGRKVRLDEKLLKPEAVTAGTSGVAYVVGEGATTDTATGWLGRTSGGSTYNPLSISDFVDIDGFYNTDLTLKPKDTAGEPNKVSAAVHYMADAVETPGMVRSGDAASERCDTLPQIAAGSGVECTMMFGSETIDKADSGDTTKTPLFGITLYGGLYDRGLFSDWINASGNANLTKWAKTVSDLGYKSYAISNAVLTEKMKGNYAFELNKDGLLNLDLNTIIQINKENVEERRGGGIMYLRTVLLVLGFALIAYVSVLLGAWALDVNLDLGLNILEKVSFHHFVAVRSLDEMPEPDPDSTTTYVDFRRLIYRCLAFAAVGVVLTMVDPVNLIIKILTALNFLLKVIGQKIFGVTIM